MSRDKDWTFDEVSELCRRAFMEGAARGNQTNPYYRGAPDADWECSKVAGELGEMCS